MKINLAGEYVSSKHTDMNKVPSSTDDYFNNLITFWYKVEVNGKIVVDEYHTIDGKYLLYFKHDIKPSCLSFCFIVLQ